MQYDKDFKLQALELSDEVGVKKASEQLGISYFTLADWRYARNKKGVSAFIGSGHKAEPLCDKDLRIKALEAELREIQHANEILKEALSFFVPCRKK